MRSQMNTKTVTLALSATSLALLAGCSGSTDYDFEASALEQQRQVAVAASYDPANGVVPLPNDVLFSGSEDGTLNIPVTAGEADDFSDPIVSLNTLDGWSTSEPTVVNFAQNASSAPVTLLDASSAILGDTVRFFEVETTQTAVTGVVAELDATQVAVAVVPTDPTTSANGSSIAIVPVQPLKQATSYMALVTNGLTDDLGRNLARGTVFDVLATVDQTDPQSAGLQTLIRAMLAAGASQGVEADDVIMAWSFTTQSITPVLQGLKDAASPRTISIDMPLGETGLLSESSPNAANIFAGSMSVPYYLDVPSVENPTAPLSSMFTNAGGGFLTPIDNTPVVKSDVTIPVLMTKPKGTPPEAGFPIAIFQHGITRNRGDMLALADAMALAGYAMIAIDLPVHGITAQDETLLAFRQEGNERHFEMDFADNETSAPGPDGITDDSGTHFYNLTNLVNTRANLRQAIADLFTVSASLGSLADIDTSQKVFIGHSLGAIVGTSYLAFDDSIKGASLIAGSGGLARMLAASPAFGPAIEAGLAGAGVDINSAAGNSFLNAAQTVTDSADPINHAASAAANTAVHMVQVNGDTVVINNLAGFPLVGTEALARNMGLATVSETTQGSGFVKVEPGYHGSILNPAVDTNNSLVVITEEQALAVFNELQAQTATFAATGAITIRNPEVLAPTE